MICLVMDDLSCNMLICFNLKDVRLIPEAYMILPYLHRTDPFYPGICHQFDKCPIST